MIRGWVLAGLGVALLSAAPGARAADAVTRTVLKTTTSVVHLHGKTVVETHQTVRVTAHGKSRIIHTVSRKPVDRPEAARRVTQVASAHPAHAVPHTRVKRLAKAAAVTAPAVVAAAAPPPAPPAPPPDPAKGTDSGLPLPRFAALRSDQVSLRAGPGTRYPIEWVYQRRDLPVEIEREFEVWRLVSEPDGTKGWVHEAMLTGRRGFLIDGDQPQTMRAAPNDTAAPVAILKPGVVGRLLSCPAAGDWCQVSVKTYSGWLPRTAFWGTLPSETVQQ